MEEIYYINDALNQLENSMDKYIDNVKYIWDSSIIPFMDSGDCMVFDNLTDKDFSKFIEFFMKQRTYTKMLETYRRLINRKEFLEKND